MNIWKKTVGALATAGLLASLFTFSAGTVLANSAPMALSGVCAPAGCSQVAATGSISMVGNVNATGFTAPTRLQVSGAGASFIAASGNFTLESTFFAPGPEFYVAGDIMVAPGIADLSGSSLTVIGTTAGTATITEQQWVTTSSQWAPDGNTWTLTFTAASSFQVSAAQSTVQTSTTASILTGPPATCGTAQTSGAANTAVTGASLCLIVRNAAGAALNGVTVSGTIQPFGLISGGQSYNGTTDANGLASFPISATGLAGATTITASATFLGVTTALPSVTFTFTGSLSKLTLTNKRFIYGQGEAASKAIKVVGADAAGNVLDLACSTTSITAATALTGLTLTAANDANGVCYISAATSATAAFGTTGVTFAVGTITSNSVTLGVSDVAASIVAAFDKTTVIPGGTATFTATLKDSAGRFAPDTESVLTVSSSGVAVNSSGATATTTLNGVATFTFLAPFNAGVASVTAFNADAGSSSASITVGSPVVVVAGSAASALGVTTSGPFSTTTKVPHLGKYVTVRISFGSSAAGAHVEIWTATKNSSGVWSAFTKLTSRVANSSGTVYYFTRSSSAKWISIRGRVTSMMTRTVQVRWM